MRCKWRGENTRWFSSRGGEVVLGGKRWTGVVLFVGLTGVKARVDWAVGLGQRWDKGWVVFILGLVLVIK